MNEYTALYVLAILLGVSALFMLGCKNERWACAGYAIHALTLCIMLAAVEGADGLDAMSVLTLACNVLAVPLVLLVAIAKTGMHERCVPAVVSPAVFMALAAGELVAGCAMASFVLAGAAQESVLLFALALTLFFVGLTAIVVQRDLFKQVFGYLLMESGTHLMLALLAPGMPAFAEASVSVVSVFVVVVMCAFAVFVSRSLGTLDTDRLHALKG